MKNVNPTVHLALFLLLQAKAFTPSDLLHSSSFAAKCPRLPVQAKTTSTTTSLYGLRSFLRRRFLGREEEQRDVVNDQDFSLHYNNNNHELEGMVSIRPPHDTSTSTPIMGSTISTSVSWSPSSLSSNPSPNTYQSTVMVQEESTGSDTNTAVLVVAPPPKNELVVVHRAELDDEVVTVPPRNEEYLTKYEKEFRQMLIEFTEFTAKDVEHIRDPRLRTLFRGIMASYHIPDAYRAFEVLYEDYAPLRIGGRLIYAQLKQAMTNAQAERHREVASITAATGLSREEIDDSRISFLQMVIHDDDKTAKLSIQQLVDYGLAETIVEVLGYNDFDGWVYNNLNVTSNTEKVGFCELMIALQSCSVDSSQPECNPATLLQEVARRMDPRQMDVQSDDSALCEKKMRFTARYNEMVDSFLEWKAFVPTGRRTRKLDVLLGCFAGAENDKIVDALRIVYVDYSALRFAGDLIFKVMKAVVVTGSGRVHQQRDTSR